MTTSTKVKRGRMSARILHAGRCSSANQPLPRLMLLSSAACIAIFGCGDAYAQVIATGAGPVRETVDSNGVDLGTGMMSLPLVGTGIGNPGQGGLFYNLRARAVGTYADIGGMITVSGSTYTVSTSGQSEVFTLSGGVLVPVEQRGSTLVAVSDPLSSHGGYDYKPMGGAVTHFTNFATTNTTPVQLRTLLTSVKNPDGEIITLNYRDGTRLVGSTMSGPILAFDKRLASITNNYGFHLHLTYAADDDSADPTGWAKAIKIVALNNVVVNCQPAINDCAASGSWPKLSFGASGSNITFTDSLSRTTTLTFGGTGSRLSAVRFPGSGSDDIAISYDGSSRVSSVARSGVTTGYTYADASGIRTTTITAPLSQTRIIKFNLATMQPVEDTIVVGGVNRTTTYAYDGSARVTRTTAPEGNYVEYTYDSRGNVTQTKAVSKTPGTPADIVTSAAFPSTCSNVITCNKPTSTTDALMNVTSYTYDSTHGGGDERYVAGGGWNQPADPLQLYPATGSL